ncbi:hypothetical protein HQ576_15435, partial [bacterium]|nr:hypothetical protein [bacterium]
LLTANPDGTDLRIVADHGMVSHFDWRDDTHILAWAHHDDLGDHFTLYTDPGGGIETLGDGLLTVDGHCTYSPDRRWFLTDTYPQGPERLRRLLLYRHEERLLVEIGAFHEPPKFQGEWRCDLHARWSRGGRRICFDSTHDGQRQLYMIDVADIVTI